MKTRGEEIWSWGEAGAEKLEGRFDTEVLHVILVESKSSRCENLSTHLIGSVANADIKEWEFSLAEISNHDV